MFSRLRARIFRRRRRIARNWLVQSEGAAVMGQQLHDECVKELEAMGAKIVFDHHECIMAELPTPRGKVQEK